MDGSAWMSGKNEVAGLKEWSTHCGRLEPWYVVANG